MRVRRILPAAACFAVLSVNATAIEPDSRAEATSIIREMRKIVSDDGVERLETVKIGGIEQWVSIRGMDRDNPVLLMIHGGPGFVAMPTSWYFQRGWEEYFTVVQWDQRGAGKTYNLHEPAMIAPTLTVDRMIKDAEAMVAWAREEFDQERIFVLGHSWGSILGLELAQRRPEWLHAYIGIGQAVDGYESERRGYRWVLERARQDGNEQAVRELEALAPYAEEGVPVSLEALYAQRKWLNFYGGAVHNRRNGSAEAGLIRLSPEYTDEDVANVWVGTEFAASHLLLDALATDFSDVTELEVPVILLNGRHDYNVSQSVAAEWFEQLKAPWKKIVWFEHSAHEIMNEEPGKTLVSLVSHALPLAKEAAD